jgi:hypothetical protein
MSNGNLGLNANVTFYALPPKLMTAELAVTEQAKVLLIVYVKVTTFPT